MWRGCSCWTVWHGYMCELIIYVDDETDLQPTKLSCFILFLLQRSRPKKPAPGSEPQGSRSMPSFMKVRLTQPVHSTIPNINNGTANGKPKQIPYTFSRVQERHIIPKKAVKLSKLMLLHRQHCFEVWQIESKCTPFTRYFDGI